jgi:hypothetical protein
MSKKQRKTQYQDEESWLWSGSVLVLLTKSSFLREKDMEGCVGQKRWTSVKPNWSKQ